MENNNQTLSFITRGLDYPISYSDLSIINFGYQAKDFNHNQGPLTKSEHVLQYMTGGKGVLEIGGKRYYLKKGDLFYLPKGTLLKYFADKTDPYTYYWVGVDGVNAKFLISRIGLSENDPVLNIDDNLIISIFEEIKNALLSRTFANFVLANAKLGKLFSLLLSRNEINTKPIKNVCKDYVEKALTFIHDNFGKDVNVTEISSVVGLKRTYFCLLFKKYTGSSPVDYLMNYRISQSKFMLLKGLNVTETALNCGFNSPSNFTAQFKKITGTTPTAYKKSFLSDNLIK